MERLYRWQAPLFDLTRAPILLGRDALADAVTARVPADASVLEVGCGTGAVLARIRARRPDVQLHGIECAPSMARRARRRVPDCDIVCGEYDAGSAADCDAILFSYSLSMFPDAGAALDTALAQLRPGGIVFVLDFVAARTAPLRAWMRGFGVDLETDRRAAVEARFGQVSYEEHRALGGLWTWALVTATQSAVSDIAALTNPAP